MKADVPYGAKWKRLTRSKQQSFGMHHKCIVFSLKILGDGHMKKN